MHTLAAIWTIAAKDLRAYFRDRVGVVLGFLLPIALITVFGYVMSVAFGGDQVMPRATLWFSDEDNSPASRRLIDLLRDSEMVQLHPRPEESPVDAAKVRTLVEQGDAPNALIIPNGYGQDVKDRKLPHLTLLRDPGRTMESRIIGVALSQTVLGASSGELLPVAMGDAMRRTGMDEGQVSQIMDAAKSLEVILAAFARAKSGQTSFPSETAGDKTNADNSSGADPATGTEKAPPKKSVVAAVTEALNQLVPIDRVDIQPPKRPKRLSFQLAQAVCGMTVMMLLFGMRTCSTSLQNERETGTLRRLLAAPVSRDSIYWGKFLFCAIIGVLQLIVMFIYGNLAFSIDAFRDIPTLAAVSLAWAAAATAFSMLIASWARSSRQADGLSTILILVMAALGGCWFPIQMMNLSPAGEVMTHSMITYWTMTAYQGLFWNQLPWYDSKMLLSQGILWGFTAVTSALALWFFRRRYVAG